MSPVKAILTLLLNLTRYEPGENNPTILKHLKRSQKEEHCPDFERSEQATVLDLDYYMQSGFTIDPVYQLLRDRLS